MIQKAVIPIMPPGIIEYFLCNLVGKIKLLHSCTKKLFNSNKSSLKLLNICYFFYTNKLYIPKKKFQLNIYKYAKINNNLYVLTFKTKPKTFRIPFSTIPLPPIKGVVSP